MRKPVTLFLLSILFISGCSDNELEKLTQENEQLKQENEKLTSLKEELELAIKIAKAESTRKTEHLTNEMGSLQSENETNKVVLNRYQKAFDVSTNSIISNSLSIFSPEHVAKGSKIAGLTVSNINKEVVNGASSYNVKFSGEFKVSGLIFKQGENDFDFIIHENLEEMPHALWQFEKGSIFFEISNSEFLKETLGDKLEKLPMEGELNIVGVFKDYVYNEFPESDFPPSHAEFVRVISEG